MLRIVGCDGDDSEAPGAGVTGRQRGYTRPTRSEDLDIGQTPCQRRSRVSRNRA